MTDTPRLAPEQRAQWDRDGFILVRGFAEADTCRAMHERVVALGHRSWNPATSTFENPGGMGQGQPLVMPEKKRDPRATRPEQRISKIFKLHRDPVFKRFITGGRLLALAAELLTDDLDCFLSQFIFKNPGAMGQPWHQDAHYFPFDRSPQVGLWLAITEATEENGCLHVLPGSHREPVHEHVPDPRSLANYGYMEITDHDMSERIPVLMQPGDLLLFHSHLMHCSFDNESERLRAAMVYHLAEAGTQDASTVGINDWLPVYRAGVPVPRSPAGSGAS